MLGRSGALLLSLVIISGTSLVGSSFLFDTSELDMLEWMQFAEAAGGHDIHHNISMSAVELPDGLYAYKMDSHQIVVDGDTASALDVTVNRYGSADPKPSIPGPTVVITEGESVTINLTNNVSCDKLPQSNVSGYEMYNGKIGIHVHGVHYLPEDDSTQAIMNPASATASANCGGDVVDFEWIAAPGTAGTWPYHDHTFLGENGAEDKGLFGTVIVKPENGKTVGFVDDDGQIQKVKETQIDKDFILWMVSTEELGRSIFYGMEIDNRAEFLTADDDTNFVDDVGRQTALWQNPNLVITEDKIVRYHVLGIGDDFHAFHLHGHRWVEPQTTKNIIDVREIAPLERHTFIIKAGQGTIDENGQEFVGPGNWMYHCHVFSHMEEGMSGMMKVLPNDVAGVTDKLPTIGAVFTISDEPGVWMKTLDAGIADSLTSEQGIGFPLGSLGPGTHFENSEGRSTAVISVGETVLWTMKDSQTVHTVTSLIWPASTPNVEASALFIDKQLPIRGSTYLTGSTGGVNGVIKTFDEPGLYVFVCKIHPYMFSAVIADDPASTAPDGSLALDIGDDLRILTTASVLATVQVPGTNFKITDVDTLASVLDTGLGAATGLQTEAAADEVAGIGIDLAKSLLTTFYVATDTNNWKDYSKSDWNVSFPPVPVLLDSNGDRTDASTNIVANMSALNIQMQNIQSDIFDPQGKPGVGEVLINTQFERTMQKNHDGTPQDKPGTITVVNANTWNIDRKVALPEINMNNPHNMWTDTANDVIYQTQWIDKRMVGFERESGNIIKDQFVGQSPSHIMTAPDTGKIYIAMNGEEAVNELDPKTWETTRIITSGQDSHPHGHWISSDGQYVVTPNFFTHNSAIIDLHANPPVVTQVTTGLAPIAIGMHPDTNDYYTADFLGNTYTKIDPANPANPTTIDITLDSLTGFGVVTGIPIQTPVSPDGKYMVTAQVLNSKLTIVDTEVGSSTQDTIVAVLPCDPGCHGVQWGAKLNPVTGVESEYYAYVSNKFSNSLIVVDPNPNIDTNGINGIETNGADASIVGRILLIDDKNTQKDDYVIGLDGMGGQGVLAIPNVYQGWIEETNALCSAADANSSKCSNQVYDFLYGANGLNASQRDP